jgi:hypothetical protein
MKPSISFNPCAIPSSGPYPSGGVCIWSTMINNMFGGGLEEFEEVEEQEEIVPITPESEATAITLAITIAGRAAIFRWASARYTAVGRNASPEEVPR